MFAALTPACFGENGSAPNFGLLHSGKLVSGLFGGGLGSMVVGATGSDGAPALAGGISMAAGCMSPAAAPARPDQGAGHRIRRPVRQPGGGEGPHVRRPAPGLRQAGAASFRWADVLAAHWNDMPAGGTYVCRRRPARGTESAAGRRVSTLELFFDLVFVCTITQLTVLLTHDLSFACPSPRPAGSC